MEIKRISDNATAYIYDDLDDYITSVFFIECERKIFIIDTFCGTKSMKPILERIRESSKEKQVVIINTHSHWDHFWGNCSFKKNDIISHELCRELINQSWDEQIREHGKYILGKAEKHLPNITFKERIIFHNEGIEVFHSPGHTRDSISVFDQEEKILYVGDNLEKPIIHVEDADIGSYVKTLQNYLNYKPSKIVASHTLYLTEADIEDTIDYLNNLVAKKEMNFQSQHMEKIHRQNLKICNKF